MVVDDNHRLQRDSNTANKWDDRRCGVALNEVNWTCMALCGVDDKHLGVACQVKPAASWIKRKSYCVHYHHQKRQWTNSSHCRHANECRNQQRSEVLHKNIRKNFLARTTENDTADFDDWGERWGRLWLNLPSHCCCWYGKLTSKPITQRAHQTATTTTCVVTNAWIF